MAVVEVFKLNNRPTGSIQPNATVAPPDTATIMFILRSEAEFIQDKALADSIKDSGRSWQEYTEWDGSNFIELADDRAFVRVTSDVAEIELPGSATLTFQVLKADGTDNTTFNGVRIYEIFGRLMKLTFSNGVALKTFTPTETGKVEFNSDTSVRLEGPLRITVVEV